MVTTISVTEEVREKIKEFGQKGETYSDIIEKLIGCARKQQLRDILMDTSNTLSVREALKKAKRQWQN